MVAIGWTALGGAIGAGLRVLVGLYAPIKLRFGKREFVSFPIGTLFVNVAASLLLGALVGLGAPTDEGLAFLSGVPGGLSTASTLAVESINLYKARKYMMLACYLMLTWLLGSLAALAGIKATS
jgi:CrcB protein